MNTKTQRVLGLSTRRTGTVFLTQVLQTILGNEAIAEHEGSGKDRIINLLANMYFAGVLSQESFQRYLEGHLKKNIDESAAYYINISPFMYGAPYIAPDLFKEFKIIHIVRDPRKFVKSAINFIYTRPTSFLAHKFLPYWMPPKTEKFFFESFLNNPYREFDQYCWEWAFKNARIEESLRNANDSLTIKFENLVDKDQAASTHQEILEFIGFDKKRTPVDITTLNKNVSKPRKEGDWQSWSNIKCYRLQVVCQPIMKIYGYGQEEHWLEKAERGKEEYKQNR